MLRELGQDLTPFEEVRQFILDHIEPLPAEDVPLEEAWDRVLSEHVVCDEPVPGFDNSAMDGYVVRASDVATANAENPVTLEVTARVAAGDAADTPLTPGSAQRIMTGAPIPEGGDAVVPHELTESTETEVIFVVPARSGQNIRRAGGDLSPGDVAVLAGARLRGPQIALVASVGRRTVRATRRPRVAILSPGKELVEPWEKPGPGQVRNSNAHGLAGFVRECGGDPTVLRIVGDDVEEIRAAIKRAIAEGADALLSTGGVSAGDFDFVRQVAEEDGRPGRVFKTSMRPGKPQVFAMIDGKPLWGLPGNPAAAIVSFTVFVRPGLRKLLGERPVVPAPFPVRLTEDIQYRAGRVFMLRARVEPDLESGGYLLASAGDQDSSFLASLSEANAIVELPADREVAPAGDIFPAHWIHPR